MKRSTSSSSSFPVMGVSLATKRREDGFVGVACLAVSAVALRGSPGGVLGAFLLVDYNGESSLSDV